jgi:hypothetical protein
LGILKGKVAERKLKLFACCCCRRVWHYLEGTCRTAVEVTERFADGEAGPGDLQSAERRAWEESQGARVHKVGRTRVSALAVWCASRTHERSASIRSSVDVSVRSSADYASLAFGLQVEGSPKDVQAQAREKAIQSDLLRDIFGNPFRPVTLDVSWLMPTVRQLAQAAYEERLLPSGELDRDRLRVLADALDDAGCQDPQILGHCRGSGPHVRGCFVIDLLLGRS